MLALLKSLKGSSSYVSSSHTLTSNTDLCDDNLHSLSKVVAGGRNRRAEPELGSDLCKDYDVNKHKRKKGEKTPGTKRRKKTVMDFQLHKNYTIKQDKRKKREKAPRTKKGAKTITGSHFCKGYYEWSKDFKKKSSQSTTKCK